MSRFELTYTSHFKAIFKKLFPSEQEKVKEAISDILSYKTTGEAPYGLRIKRLRPKIFEARVDLYIRIVFFAQGNMIRMIALGNHDDILRTLRQIDRIDF
ncbi:MAG: hypothetical protein HYS07_01215 [Chlamydiae bacterium]|nr:hypothetical protein [Chlamydiota bacterium]MBI3276540.1 hypothetical protein [Chlamydiota bacterium]